MKQSKFTVLLVNNINILRKSECSELVFTPFRSRLKWWSYQNRECYLQFHLNLSNQYFRLLRWCFVSFPAIGEMEFIRNRYSHCKHSMGERGNKFPEGWIIDVTTSVHVCMVLRQLRWGRAGMEKREECDHTVTIAHVTVVHVNNWRQRSTDFI